MQSLKLSRKGKENTYVAGDRIQQTSILKGRAEVKRKTHRGDGGQVRNHRKTRRVGSQKTRRVGSQKPSEEGASRRRVAPAPNARRSQMSTWFEHEDAQDGFTGAVSIEAGFRGTAAGYK